MRSAFDEDSIALGSAAQRYLLFEIHQVISISWETPKKGHRSADVPMRMVRCDELLSLGSRSDRKPGLYATGFFFHTGGIAAKISMICHVARSASSRSPPKRRPKPKKTNYVIRTTSYLLILITTLLTTSAIQILQNTI